MNFSRISKPLICIASEIGATETALFAVVSHHRLGRSLKCVMHIRWDDPDTATRQAAIDAFQDLILPCIDQQRDGVICVADSPSQPGYHYCLIVRLQRHGELIGVLTFIVSRENLETARTTLERVRTGVQKLGL